MESPTLPDSATFVFARADDYFFGVLHSRLHEVWARAQGTQLRERESGFRNPNERGIGTVRYPRLVPRDADCAAKLSKRTLTNLYNQRPTWLVHAHRKLDEAVFAAYGWDGGMTDEEILERLLELNLTQSP